MKTDTQAVLFNAVPLLVVAALYLAVGLSMAPALWRSRERSRAVRFGMALVFPSAAAAAGIVGTEVLLEREPLGGHLWPSLAAIILAAVPALVLLPSWRDQGALVSAVRRTREAEERSSLRERELEAVGRLSRALLDANDTESVGRALLDELASLFELDLANLFLVEGPEARQARIVVAREEGRDNDELTGQVIDLDRETSGVRTAVRDAVAFAIYGAESSPVVNKRLNEIAKVKSCAFVPVVAAEQVLGVVFGGVRKPRAFRADELELMQAFAAEAGLALQRVRSAAALAEALERERLVARFSLELRSRRDLDELLRLAVSEIAKTVGVVRCFVRLGEPDGPMPVAAEWEAEGAPPLGDAGRLPVSNLAARERRSVAIGDVLNAPELADVETDPRELVARGERASLSTPIIAFDRVIGVLGLHRSEAREWTEGEISLAEAIAREAAIAIDTGRLLRESDRRVAEQRALLKAGEALTSDLRFDAVIDGLVKEIRALVQADAADCWTFVPGGHELVCRAVLGLPETEVGRRIRVEGTVGEAIASGKPVLRRDFAATEQPPPASHYAAFAEVMNAPIFSFGEIRGVLGVWSREPGRFEDSDLRLIEAFASLASVALRNAEAYEESRRQTQVERAFYRIAAVLSEPLSAEATLDAVAQAAAEALGGDSAAVLRMVAGELELAGAHDLAPELANHLAVEAAELVACARAGKVLASRRLRDDGRFDEALATAAERAGRRSLLAVPLAQPRGEGAGIVLVFFEDEQVFDDDQLELARHVAGAARGALERSELYERERRSRSLAQRLARAGRELAGELDPDTVLDQCARLAIELVDADGASVRVLEDDELVVRAAAGAGEVDALGGRVPSTAWLVGDIVQTRSTRSVPDVRTDPRIGEVDSMLAAGYAAYLGVPVVGPDGAAQGVLAVYANRPRGWLEEEAEALQTLAATAAAARANADLYQEVSNQQQRSEAILANVADGIVAVDREGKVVLWNPAAERVTGVSQEEALGRTPAEALGRTLESDERLGGSRLVSIRRGGEEVWLSLSEAVMTDPAGAVAGRIYAFRDISSERRVEQMKSGFVSTVSHELRTPLTSIYGFAETLLRQDVLFGEEERNTFLRYISSESERLMSIVDRLLSVAEADSGELPIQLVEVDVAAVVSDAVRAAESADGRKRTRFVVALPEEKLVAQADGEKLGQALSHLLDNAVRYSPEGGTVTVAARNVNGTVEVRVEDEGAGIPHSEQELIFRKLYRGDAVAGAVGAGATGLGLFLAKTFVNAMNGEIRVDSQEGQGSTFVLELRAAGSGR